MLDTFAGNREIKETLKSIIHSGRFPHAFIIEGEEKSGRHLLAKIIAAAAVCSGTHAPCGSCRECSLVQNDGHCDVLTYKPDGATFKIDTIREIRENAYIMPIEAKQKVNIILDCDKMTEPAQNAFLKVLEEPPKAMIFILVCQNARSLLTTVRSRCVTLNVTNPGFDEALNYILLKTGDLEDNIKEALKSSHGNIGKALDILSGDTAEAVLRSKEFLQAFKQRDRLSALKIMHKLEKDRLGFMAFLSELRLLAQREALLCAKNESELSAPQASRLLKVIEYTELKHKKHIGQPLSIPLNATLLCAETFADI